MICIYSGGLDFSGPVNEFFYAAGSSSAEVDSVINLTGFALVGGPASQDHPKAIETLAKLDRPYLCAVPLVFQSFEELSSRYWVCPQLFEFIFATKEFWQLERIKHFLEKFFSANHISIFG